MFQRFRTNPTTNKRITVGSPTYNKLLLDGYVDDGANLSFEQKPIETVVYFGAGWDNSLLKKSLYRRFKRHLYIDALPNLQHYTPEQLAYADSHNEDAFINAIADSLIFYGILERTNIGNKYIFKLRNDIIIEYWINTTVHDALNNDYLKKEIFNAEHIYTKGFNPFEHGLDYLHINEIYRNINQIQEANNDDIARNSRFSNYYLNYSI